MPALETLDRRQKALLWAATGYDENGQVTVSLTSREIQVRWVNTQSVQLGPTNQPIAVDASVTVNEDIDFGSVMWEGGYDDLAAALPGTGLVTDTDVPLTGLMYVVSVNKTPDIKNRVHSRSVGLKWLADAMPTQT